MSAVTRPRASRKSGAAPARAHDDPSDLRSIDGVGEQSADLLRRAGLNTPADLARFDTPAQLHEHLESKGVGKVTSRNTEHWHAEAKRLVAGQSAAATPVASPSQSAARRQHAGFSVFFKYSPNERGEDSWHTRVWRTSAYHDESGQEVEFEGFEPGLWVPWILEQAGLPVPASLAPASAGADEQTDGPIASRNGNAELEQDARLRVTTVEIAAMVQPPDDASSQMQFTIRFGIEGAGASRIVDARWPYLMELVAIDPESSRPSTVMVSTHGQLEPESVSYELTGRCDIPSIGSYRTVCAVSCFSPGGLTASCEGPRLNVVELEHSPAGTETTF